MAASQVRPTGLLSTLNATIQLVLPEWVRARGLSYYLVAVSLGQAVGGIVRGALAGRLDLRIALLTAAGACCSPRSSLAWFPCRT